MSLLLDALKKAAQQKAEKSSQETPDAPEALASDETRLDLTAEDTSVFQDADDNLQQVRRDLGDETELTQMAAEQTDMSQSAPQTDAREDETELTQLATEQTELSQSTPQTDAHEDETELTQMAAEQTDLSQLASQTDAVELKDHDSREDETDLSQMAAEQTDMSQAVRPVDSVDENDTDVSDPEPDQTDPSRVWRSIEDETDVSQPAATADEIEKALQSQTDLDEDTDLSGDNTSQFEARIAQAEAEITQANVDEDMALLLVERGDSTLTGRTSITDQQTPQEQREVLDPDSPDNDEIDEIALVDTTRHQIASEATVTAAKEQTSTTAPISTALDTQTGDSTTGRTDSTTSTQTYAPDNYDRTLVKAPSDEASQIFAGMKSESDVVMTPDYAKKVFHSKSSAQRIQHYKLYGGIAVAFLLAISIFGAFEFQEESYRIDASLRPLKLDPLPGVIKSGAQEEQNTNLFTQTETEVDVRTIEIVENAGTVAADGAIVAEETDPAVVEPVVVASAEKEPEIEMANLGQTESGQVSSTNVEKVIQSETAAAESESNSSNLQISSSNRIAEKDTRLSQAYAAYQAGNDELAMTLYNEVLEVDPGNRNALLARAAINVQNNNHNAAIVDYQTLLLANPKDSLAMASLISITSYAPGDIETQLKLMIRDEPESPYLNFALANAYGAQNRWREAQGYYFKAFVNNPNDPNYAYNLAVSLEHISQPQSALSYYLRALDNFGNGLATFDRSVVEQRVELLAKL